MHFFIPKVIYINVRFVVSDAHVCAIKIFMWQSQTTDGYVDLR